MPLVLRAAVEDDIPRILQVMDAAFAQDPWHLIMKPSQPPPHAKVKAFERFRNELVDDPVVTFMVVEDTDINETVAFARWNFYREERPKSEWEKEPQIEWDEGTNRDAANAFLNGIFEKRRQIMGGKPHFLLNMLDCHPDHQRKGAGRLLVNWGTEIADKEGLPCYLEASPAGLRLYRNVGFEEVENFDLDMARWGGQGIHRHVCMLRKPKQL